VASVRVAAAQDAARCAEIVAGLEDFFTDDVPDKVQRDLREHGGWVIDAAGDVVGFVIVERRGARAAEILGRGRRRSSRSRSRSPAHRSRAGRVGG
jgi:hypothetical protein